MESMLLKILTDISDNVRSTKKLHNINRGGCAYFASYVRAYLDVLGVQSKFVYIGSEDWVINGARSIKGNISDVSNGSASTSHVMLKIGSVYYDANGIHNSKTYIEEKWSSRWNVKRAVAFTMDTVKYYQYALVEKRYEWNTQYDYRNNNPTLKRIIKKGFDGVLSYSDEKQIYPLIESLN